jgi:hypothetical protein
MHPLAVMLMNLEFEVQDSLQFADPITTVRCPEGAHFVNRGSELHVTQAWQWLPFENEFPDWVFEDLSST